MHTHWMDNGTLGIFLDSNDSDETRDAYTQIDKRLKQLHAEMDELKAQACAEKKRARIESDRRRVAEYYLLGKDKTEIADEVDLSEDEINEVVEEAAKIWKEQSNDQFLSAQDDLLVQQLNVLHGLIRFCDLYKGEWVFLKSQLKDQETNS